MNQPQQYMDVNQNHAPTSASATSMSQYSSYGQPQSLQPAAPHAGYAQPAGYPQYPYSNSMAPMSGGHPSTSMGGQMVQPLPLPTMATSQQPPPGGNQQYPQQPFDTTGQVAPAGMKPRVTATLWEDEGSLCFQVEANGVCVARREDNHMINGTKLLNVAGMTRGRRDGILKSEKTRHVVKIGPMHLKGVWIPFDRALDFANKEKITELLYPLFVHNIGALLYHPTNQARQSIGNAAMAARRPEQPEYMRTPQSTQPPSLPHHHSMTTPIGGSMPQPPHSLAPHPSSGRPGIDRAHTFPTPPASASSMTMGMGNTGSSYEYGGATGNIHPGQPLSIDTGLTSRTMPTTPASTPPGNSQGVQYQTSHSSYDSQRQQMYQSTPSTYGQYSQQPSMTRYAPLQSSPSGAKTEMGPPARTGTENEQTDAKPVHDNYGGQHDAEGDHEGEYTHANASYSARRSSYTNQANPPAGPVPPQPTHIAPEMTHSPHQNGSRGATPRTTHPYSTGYATPQRIPPNNPNYIMSNEPRAGAPNGPDYGHQAGYQPAPQYPSMNGAVSSNKRVREDDNEDPYGRPMSAGGDAALKRQRTDPSVMSARPMSQPQALKAGMRR